VTLAERV